MVEGICPVQLPLPDTASSDLRRGAEWQTLTNREQVPSAPCLQNPAELGMGEGGENVCFLTKSFSFSFPNRWKNMEAKERGEEPFLAAGDAAHCPAGTLRGRRFSGGLHKGTQTNCRRGRETRRSTSRFKMQIPPLYSRWRGQGLPISSSARLPPALLPPSSASFV